MERRYTKTFHVVEDYDLPFPLSRHGLSKGFPKGHRRRRGMSECLVLCIAKNSTNLPQHHPKITIDGTKLTISTHTHSATIPGMVFKDKTSPYRKFPGITLRDVRLAIEAEVLLERRMFMDSSIAPVPNPSGQCPVTILEVSGYRIPSSTTSFPNEEDEPSPSDIDDVLSTLPLHTFVGVESHIAAIPDVTGSWSIRIWKGEAIDRPINKLKCQACGGKHALATCTQRHRYPPKGVCKLCEGSHWLIDCPLYVRRKPKLPGY